MVIGMNAWATHFRFHVLQTDKIVWVRDGCSGGERCSSRLYVSIGVCAMGVPEIAQFCIPDVTRKIPGSWLRRLSVGFCLFPGHQEIPDLGFGGWDRLKPCTTSQNHLTNSTLPPLFRAPKTSQKLAKPHKTSQNHTQPAKTQSTGFNFVHFRLKICIKTLFIENIHNTS